MLYKTGTGQGYCPHLEKTAHYSTFSIANRTQKAKNNIAQKQVPGSSAVTAIDCEWSPACIMGKPCYCPRLRQLTLQVSDKQAPIGLLIHPVLEGATLLASLWVSSQEIYFLAIPDRVFHKFPNQLLLHCCIGDVISRAMNKKNRNDPETKG